MSLAMSRSQSTGAPDGPSAILRARQLPISHLAVRILSAVATPASILVVDDEESIQKLLTYPLEREGFHVVQARDGEEALERFDEGEFDLIVLDLALPKLDGLEVCRRLRSRSIVPIIMLTARDDEVDKVLGLELGADDYVTKPFSPRELTVRVRNVLRRSRSTPADAERVFFGTFEVDSAAREVHRDGKPLRLTVKEFDLLWFLVSHPRRVFSRDQLMDRVWGYTTALDTGTVTVHIRRLREKIESDPSQPQLLETVWGVGYRFTP
jgi:DNA-binding response OmpR family regulator